MPDHPLRRWRKECKLTLEQLAVRVGEVTPSHLSEIETGRNTPSLVLAARISRATANEAGVPAVPLTEFVPQSEAAE
jgi:transcriptional regulator with XRE-family HTH domain